MSKIIGHAINGNKEDERAILSSVFMNMNSIEKELTFRRFSKMMGAFGKDPEIFNHPKTGGESWR